jgi:hypothetical protein
MILINHWRDFSHPAFDATQFTIWLFKIVMGNNDDLPDSPLRSGDFP